jgi:hypothetical protein
VVYPRIQIHGQGKSGSLERSPSDGHLSLLIGSEIHIFDAGAVQMLRKILLSQWLVVPASLAVNSRTGIWKNGDSVEGFIPCVNSIASSGSCCSPARLVFLVEFAVEI